MTEVDYGGGGHRTWLKINDQLVCLWGAPSPVYKGVEEGRAGPLYGTPQGGFLLLVGVGFPPFSSFFYAICRGPKTDSRIGG